MLTMQEMFDKAWNGLKAQNWERSYSPGAGCVYAKRDASGAIVARCAWGHVDPEGTENATNASVNTLCLKGIGLAANLTGMADGKDQFNVVEGSDLSFAERLQRAHDYSDDPFYMQNSLRMLAGLFGLTVPE